MAIYFCAYAYLAILAISSTCIFKNHSEKRKEYLSIGCFLMLFFLIALRHPSMGVDLGYGRSWGYITSFHKIASMSWEEVFALKSFMNYEKGYVLLNKLIATIYPNTQFYIAIIAFLSLVPVFFYVHKNSNAPVCSTIVYMGVQVFLLTYSGLRQCIAIALCCLAVEFIKTKQLFKFLLLIIVSCFFHSSSIVFVLAYPLYYVKLNFQMRLISLLFLPVLWIAKKPVFVFLCQVFGYTPKIDNNGAITLFLVFCLVYWFCLVFAPKSENGNLNLFFVACCIQAMAGLQSNLIRAGYSYAISLIVLLPNTAKSIQNKKTKFIVNIVVIGAFVAFGLYSIYTTEWAQAYPYIPHWKNV